MYYGYAQVAREKEGESVLSEEDGKVFPMVMSLGLNPFYKNERLSAVSPTCGPSSQYPLHLRIQEIHIMHDFSGDFYDHNMKVAILGYIRPELDYVSRGMLQCPQLSAFTYRGL